LIILSTRLEPVLHKLLHAGFTTLPGVASIAITLDYFLFNGYCTNVSCDLFSQAYIQILSELNKFTGLL